VTSSEGPVTVVLSRTIKPGREDDYRRWVSETTQAMSRFPGFVGAAFNEPTALNSKWVFMPRWESTDHLLAWDASPQLQQRIETLLPLIEGGTDRQRHQGLDMWFPPPTPTAPRPARWKMIAVTLLVLWPTVLVLTAFLNLFPALHTLPWLLAPLPMLVLMVPMLEFWLMPAATKLFARFLFDRS